MVYVYISWHNKPLYIPVVKGDVKQLSAPPINCQTEQLSAVHLHNMQLSAPPISCHVKNNDCQVYTCITIIGSAVIVGTVPTITAVLLSIVGTADPIIVMQVYS